jgi:hypothetical protein
MPRSIKGIYGHLPHGAPFILRPMQILRTVAFLSIALSSIVSRSQQLQGTAAQTSATRASLDQTIEQSHRALNAILNGNPKLYEELFAQRDDITLGNPFGPFALGRAAVVKTFAGAGRCLRDVHPMNKFAQYPQYLSPSSTDNLQTLNQTSEQSRREHDVL